MLVSVMQGPAKAAALARAANDDGTGELGEDGAVREYGAAYLKTKKGGKKKEAFFLDLTGPPPADMEKKMSKSKASTQLAVVKGAKESESNTLPEDLRYSLDTLRRLFLRPRCVCVRVCVCVCVCRILFVGVRVRMLAAASVAAHAMRLCAGVCGVGVCWARLIERSCLR